MLLTSLKFVLLLNCMVHEETAICNDRVSIDTSCMMNVGAFNGERLQQKGSKNPAVIHSLGVLPIWELRWIFVVTHPSGQRTNLHRCHASLSWLPYGQEDCFRRRALWSKVNKVSAKTCLLEHLLQTFAGCNL